MGPIARTPVSHPVCYTASLCKTNALPHIHLNVCATQLQVPFPDLPWTPARTSIALHNQESSEFMHFDNLESGYRNPRPLVTWRVRNAALRARQGNVHLGLQRAASRWRVCPQCATDIGFLGNKHPKSSHGSIMCWTSSFIG